MFALCAYFLKDGILIKFLKILTGKVCKI